METYYHGTSEVFLKGIKQEGLGGVHLAKQAKLHDLVQYLVVQCEHYCKRHSVYLANREVFMAIARQGQVELFGEIGNFEYKGTYVTSLEGYAVSHAMINKLGSELLSHAIWLLQILKSCDKRIEIPVNIDRFNLESCIKLSPARILVTFEASETELCHVCYNSAENRINNEKKRNSSWR